MMDTAMNLAGLFMIFFARIIDVSCSIVRILFLVKGQRCGRPVSVFLRLWSTWWFWDMCWGAEKPSPCPNCFFTAEGLPPAIT